MSAENTSTETVTTSTEETSGQGVENTEGTETTSTETVENNGQEPNNPSETRLPDDHPLVKTLSAQKDELKQLKDSHQTKVTELETQVTELTAKAESADAIQAKYDRLEAFLTSLGGPVSKALDSRSFSKALFESDQDINDLVAKWHRDNPSATSSALNSGAGSELSTTDMNKLLRSAAK